MMENNLVVMSCFWVEKTIHKSQAACIDVLECILYVREFLNYITIGAFNPLGPELVSLNLLG